MIPMAMHQPTFHAPPPVEYVEVVEKPIKRALVLEIVGTTKSASVRGTPKLSSTQRAVVMYRLGKWGAWIARNSDAGCGYPKRSPFVRLAPPDPDARHAIYYDDDEAEVDRIVCSLDDDTRSFLLLHFAREGTAKDKAAGMGISRTWYGLLLDKAVYEVHTKLG